MLFKRPIPQHCSVILMGVLVAFLYCTGRSLDEKFNILSIAMHAQETAETKESALTKNSWINITELMYTYSELLMFPCKCIS